MSALSLERPALAWLAGCGWETGEPFDVCWLDCPEPGFLLRHRGRVICLCPGHALILQSGCWDGDYAGAPLPPETRARAWPWAPGVLFP